MTTLEQELALLKFESIIQKITVLSIFKGAFMLIPPQICPYDEIMNQFDKTYKMMDPCGNKILIFFENDSIKKF